MKHTLFLMLALPLGGQELKDCKDVPQGPCINKPLLQMLERTWPEEQRTAPFQSPSFVKPPITLDCMTCNVRTMEVKPEDLQPVNRNTPREETMKPTREEIIAEIKRLKNQAQKAWDAKEKKSDAGRYLVLIDLLQWIGEVEKR